MKILFYVVISSKDLPHFAAFWESLTEYLGCLEKFKSEYVFQWELLLIFNGLTDEERNAAQNITVRSSIITQTTTYEDQRGLKTAINDVIRTCSFDLLCRLDPDDQILPEPFKDFTIKVIQKSADYDYFYSDLFIMDKSGRIVDSEEWAAQGGMNNFISQPPHGAFTFVSYELIAGYNYFDDIPRQDGYETWLRVLTKKFNAWHYSDKTFIYRQGLPSLASQFEKVIRDRNRILERVVPQGNPSYVFTFLPGFDAEYWWPDFKRKFLEFILSDDCANDIILVGPTEEILTKLFANQLIENKTIIVLSRTQRELLPVIKEAVSLTKAKSFVWINPREFCQIDHLMIKNAGNLAENFDVAVLPTILCRKTVFKQDPKYGLVAVNLAQPMQPRAFKRDCYIVSNAFVAGQSVLVAQSEVWDDIFRLGTWSMEIDYMGDVF